MSQPNFKRMLDLIDTVFATREDKNQLQVNQRVMKKLEQLHSATLSELADENGPGIWVLLIPTTKNVMEGFLNEVISEKDILKNTNPGESFDCIYLCSATALPEYRGKGATKQLCINAITSICKDYPIETLFVWPFSNEGERLAEKIAKQCELNLLKRKH